MRVCFDSLCFASLSEEGEQQQQSMDNTDPKPIITSQDMSRSSTGALAGSVEELEARIKHLESELKKKDEEILELKSHLDKFQSVFPFHMSPPSQTNNNNNNNNNNTYYNKGEVASNKPRKQRAQGISAEPQDISTIQELAKCKFPVVTKNDR